MMERIERIILLPFERDDVMMNVFAAIFGLMALISIVLGIIEKLSHSVIGGCVMLIAAIVLNRLVKKAN